EDQPVEGKSWSVKYWADPGNEQWQEFFATKLNLALERSAGSWDGVILDEFLTGHTSTAAGWAGGGVMQAKYATDQAWQEAQLDFLRYVAPRVKVPLVPNVEPVVLNPTSEGFNPEFFTEVQRIAGGAEAEIFVYHRPDRGGFLGREMVQAYLERVRRTPPGKMMFLNSATAASFGGNPDLTLFTYFTYLLVAGPDREVYWTCKEGDSEIPHFWYREFDLDLGPPQEEMQTVGGLWKRDFANATVVVNPGSDPAAYSFPATFADVLNRPLRSPVTLKSQTGILLIKKKDGA
ncbi:MAG: putative glycoside hydrolase family 15 protein, partial [Planctomycetes bacterium]|nr:putative glycoside hydrolase family 15 protein [Planctomycetota bacterium]